MIVLVMLIYCCAGDHVYNLQFGKLQLPEQNTSVSAFALLGTEPLTNNRSLLLIAPVSKVCVKQHTVVNHPFVSSEME